MPGRSIADTRPTAEMLVAVSTPDQEAVDTMVATAIAAGGRGYRESAGHGWAYYAAFQELDGHIREALAFDESLLSEEMPETGG